MSSAAPSASVASTPLTPSAPTPAGPSKSQKKRQKRNQGAARKDVLRLSSTSSEESSSDSRPCNKESRPKNGTSNETSSRVDHRSNGRAAKEACSDARESASLTHLASNAATDATPIVAAVAVSASLSPSSRGATSHGHGDAFPTAGSSHDVTLRPKAAKTTSAAPTAEAQSSTPRPASPISESFNDQRRARISPRSSPPARSQDEVLAPMPDNGVTSSETPTLITSSPELEIGVAPSASPPITSPPEMNIASNGAAAALSTPPVSVPLNAEAEPYGEFDRNQQDVREQNLTSVCYLKQDIFRLSGFCFHVVIFYLVFFDHRKIRKLKEGD